ncbi:MAG TPA: transaldolase family protein, partial [Cellvibrionaceae bacterium]|nr:transaldolase family protein [Cellvibrionaceae bacterium]
ALAGCDRLTISPELLAALETDTGTLSRALEPGKVKTGGAKVVETEAQFRFNMNEDQMATEKLSDGIRKFVADQINLENFLASVKG